MLKKGSKGIEVERLQTILGILSDGIFGPKTEAAVKKFQLTEELIVDGIVGPKTMAALGMISTDVEEKTRNSTTEFKINKDLLPPGEYYEGKTNKTRLFLHHTAGWHNPYNTVSGWAKDSRGRVATEFVIGGQSVKGNEDRFDGEVVKCIPTGGYGWHLGACSRKTHIESVGIEVCNFGSIKEGKTWAKVTADSDQIIELAKPFKGNKFWHKYSDKQIQSLKDLILHIAKRDNIDPRKGLVELIHTMGEDAFSHYNVSLVEKTPGLWNHTNVRRDKVDMFPQQELIDMLLSL